MCFYWINVFFVLAPMSLYRQFHGSLPIKTRLAFLLKTAKRINILLRKVCFTTFFTPLPKTYRQMLSEFLLQNRVFPM